MAMLFDRHEHAGASEHSTPYLEVPPVVLAPGLHSGVAGAQGRLEGPQALLVRLPPFGPDPERARPGKHEPVWTTPPPGCEAARQTTTQARQGLEEMEECCQATQPEHLRGAGSGRAREGSPGRAHAGLEERKGEGPGRHRQGE